MVKSIYTVFALVLLFNTLYADSLYKMAGAMLIVGFEGDQVTPKSQICKDIKRYNLAGVILFEKNPTNPKGTKNILSPKQLSTLTKNLQNCSSDKKLLIAIDEEGGVVQRLKKRYGFYGSYPRASVVAQKGTKYAAKIYSKMAKELSLVGINYNLAPVVDLAINPKNKIIVGYGRSFGKDPNIVAKYANIFIDNMHKRGIVTSLKHFPGHGSSIGDTHKGFVDVTKEWSSIEIEPYRLLLKQNSIDSVMVAHIFNKNLDAKYPASLSKNIIDNLLRKELGYSGVVITDDLQMGAITKHYNIKDTIRLAIKAGNDILLFGNQLDPKKVYSPQMLVDTIVSLVKEGTISIDRLKESKERIEKLKSRLNSIEQPKSLNIFEGLM